MTTLSLGLQRIQARQPEVVRQAIELRAALGILNIGCPYCDLNTAGEHQPQCPNASRRGHQHSVDRDGPPLAAPFSPTGWLCPRCDKSLAPWVRECDCGPMTYIAAANSCMNTESGNDEL